MKEYFEKCFNRTIKIDDGFISKFSKALLEILDEELLKGNCICETFKGDWPYKNPESKMIFLAKPFCFKPQKELKGIKYIEVNDPHYWKAEYYDTNDNSFLCCKF